MEFLNADSTFILVALLTLIGVVWVQRLGADRRRRIVETFVGTSLADKLTATLDPAKRRTRQILLVVGLAFVFLAAARPWWGKRLVHAPKRSRDVLVALDCSRSMLARDIAPTRLKHAQWWLRELMKDCVGDRFGLIAFAGDAFLECPLTQDVNTVFQFLDDLDTDTIPVGGTNMETALAAAHEAFEGAEGTHRAVLLVTDGDELEGDASEEIEFFRRNNIPLFVVGVGTPQGSMVQMEDNSYLRDAEGELVLAKLNETGLRKLAESTHGIYVRSTAVNANVDPVKRRIRELVPQDQDATTSYRTIDRYQVPLFIGVVLLLVRLLLSERVKGVRAVAALLVLLAAGTGQAQESGDKADDKPVIMLPSPGSLQAAPPPGQVAPGERPPGTPGQQPPGPTPEQRAAAREKMLRDAVATTRKELENAEPEQVARLHFNLGFLYQQLHDIEKAEEEYREAMRLGADQSVVKGRACQNLGVISQTQAAEELTADPEKCLKLLKNAETCYLEAMRETPGSEDVCQNQEMLLRQRMLALQLKEVADKLAELRKKAQEQTGKAMEEQTQANAAENARDKVREQAQAKAYARQARAAVDEFEEAVRQLQQEQAADVVKQAGEEIEKAIQAEDRAMQSLSNEEERKKAGDEAVQHLQKALELLGVKPPQQDKQDEKNENKDGQGQNQEPQQGDQEKEDEKEGENEQQGEEQPPGEEQEAQQAKEGEEEEGIDENRARAILLQIQDQEKELREALKEERMKNAKLKGVDRNW